MSATSTAVAGTKLPIFKSELQAHRPDAKLNSRLFPPYPSRRSLQEMFVLYATSETDKKLASPKPQVKVCPPVQPGQLVERYDIPSAAGVGSLLTPNEVVCESLEKTKLAHQSGKSSVGATAATISSTGLSLQEVYKKYSKIFSKYAVGIEGDLKIKNGKYKGTIVGTVEMLAKVLIKIDACRDESIVKTDGKMVVVPNGSKNDIYIIKGDIIGKGPADLHIVRLCKEGELHDKIRRVWVVSEGTFLPIKIGLPEKIKREVGNVEFLQKSGEYSGFQDKPLMVVHTSKFSCYVSRKEYIDLFAWMEQNPPDPINPQKNKIRESLCEQLLANLAEMWARGVRHGDLKPENILVHVSNIPNDGGDIEQKIVLKFIDFEGARKFKEEDSKEQFSLVPYTPRYCTLKNLKQMMALAQKGTNEADFLKFAQNRDVFAIGLIMYCLLAGHPPYHYDSNTFPAGKIVEGDINKFGYNTALIDLVKRMIDLSAEARIPFTEALAKLNTLT
jgi:serine/threonine protein kinase